MSPRKVAVVVASRANYGRVKTVLEAVRAHPALRLQLVVGASALLQRFGKVVDVIRRDGFEPDAVVHMILEGETPTTMAKSTGLGLLELPTIFENLRPDVVVTVADRFETIATAIAAAYMNIPVAHIQGGEITGSIDESVRHAITRLAHVHFPATQAAAERIARMGEDRRFIFRVGCPSIDVVARIDRRLDFDPLEKYGGVGARLDLHRPFLLVLQHPVTTEYGQGLEQVGTTLQAIRALRMPTIWLWPNVDAGSEDVSKGIRMFREAEKPDYIHLFRNFAVEDYIKVLASSACVAGNSSSAIREGAWLGTPAVNIGSRQEGRERGRNVVDVPHEAEAIRGAIERQVAHGRYDPDPIYGDGNAGTRIAEILAGLPEIPVQKRLQL